jgi:flagellar biosynthesis/type III secretory pathway protein FliH
VAERFVSFTELFRSPEPRIADEGVVREPVVTAASPEPPRIDDGFDALMRDVRLFRAHLIEALEDATASVVREIAASVLARELALAPADLERIVDSTLAEYLADEPLAIRVNPAEASKLTERGIPIVADETLRPGDAVLQLRSGSVNRSLGVRLERVLREVCG